MKKIILIALFISFSANAETRGEHNNELAKFNYEQQELSLQAQQLATEQQIARQIKMQYDAEQQQLILERARIYNENPNRW